MADWYQGYNWLNGLELLSLDFLRPVYADLGTGIILEETLRGLARDAILWRLDPSHHAQPGSPEGMAMFLRSQVEALLGVAEAALGEGAQDALVHWIRYVQCQESSNPWTRYRSVLSSWASHLRRTGRDEIGFSFDPQEIARQLGDTEATQRVRKVLERQSRVFLTPWDFPLFRCRGALDMADDSPFFPFIDPAILTVDMYQFQSLWKRWGAVLPQRDLEAVETFVRKAEGEDAPYVRLSDLPKNRRM